MNEHGRFRRLSRNPDVQALLLLAVLSLVFLFPFATMQGIFFNGDANDYFTRLAYTAERIRSGQAPLWDPYLSLGGTHAGDPAGLTWYVPTLVLFQILPPFVAYNYTFILHLFLAASGMYLLARAWDLPRASALLAAFVFGFSGFVVAHLQHLNIVVGTAWLPWIFLALEKFLTTRRAFYVGLGALALGMQLLGGHTQTVLYGGVAWGAYCAVWMVRTWRAGEHREVARQIAGVTAMFVLALGIAAIFLAPFVELLGFIARSDRVTYDFATSFSLEPVRLLEFVHPYLFGGNPGTVERGAGSLIEMTGYVGMFALVLAFFAAAQREWRVYFLYGLGIVALLLALGKFTPLYWIVYRLPLFGSVRAPARFLELVVFALALLAGFGFEVLRQSVSRRLVWAALGALGLVVVGLAGVVVAPRLGIQPSDTFAQASGNRIVYLYAAFAMGSGALAILWVRRQFSPRVLVAASLAFVLVELFSFGAMFRYNEVTPTLVYEVPGKTARLLIRQRNRFNTYYWGVNETKLASYLQKGDNRQYMFLSRAGIRQSLPLWFKIRSMQGYGSEPPVYSALLLELEGSKKFDHRTVEWLGHYGAQQILSPVKFELPDLQLVERNGTIAYFQTEVGMPRAGLAQKAVSASSPEAALDAVKRGALQDGSVVLETPNVESYAPTTGSASIVQDDPEYVVVNVTADNAPTYLVLNDTYYPGWAARVDGVAAPLYRANGLVRAVPVPQGTHRVEFVYDPVSFKIGAGVSALALVLVLGGLVATGRRKQVN